MTDQIANTTLTRRHILGGAGAFGLALVAAACGRDRKSVV